MVHRSFEYNNFLNISVDRYIQFLTFFSVVATGRRIPNYVPGWTKFYSSYDIVKSRTILNQNRRWRCKVLFVAAVLSKSRNTRHTSCSPNITWSSDSQPEGCDLLGGRHQFFKGRQYM